MLVEPAVEIALPVLHEKQAHVEAHARRFNLVRAGRRWGKDVLGERRLIRRVSNVASQSWYAPSYRMMVENYQSIHNRIAPIVTRATESLHRLELVNGAVIKFWSLDNFDAARGQKDGHVTINEAAAAPNLKEAWQNVIRPTLADLEGGADFWSTPRGLNFFYELERDNKDWGVFHFTTYDNPYIPRGEIEAMKASLPETVFRQEILAEYVESGAFFQNIDEVCVIDAPANPKDHAGHAFSAGLDLALTEDFTRLLVLCRTCSKAVDWWGGNRMDYFMQRGHIMDTLKKWPGVVLLPERNSMGVPNIEEFHRDGITLGKGPDKGFGFQTTSTTKADLILGLALAMQKKEVQLPREYADELRAYEVEMTAANPKFSAPSGQHDDRVIAAALAWWNATNVTWWMS